LTAAVAWSTSMLIGTTGASVVMATRTPAAAMVARFGMPRSRSSTFERLVKSGP
jgi:hypothetical protein